MAVIGPDRGKYMPKCRILDITNLPGGLAAAGDSEGGVPSFFVMQKNQSGKRVTLRM